MSGTCRYNADSDDGDDDDDFITNFSAHRQRSAHDNVEKKNDFLSSCFVVRHLLLLLLLLNLLGPRFTCAGGRT